MQYLNYDSKKTAVNGLLKIFLTNGRKSDMDGYQLILRKLLILLGLIIVTFFKFLAVRATELLTEE